MVSLRRRRLLGLSSGGSSSLSTLPRSSDSGDANPNGSLISTGPMAFGDVEVKECTASIGSTQSSNGSDSSSSSMKQSDENSTVVGVKRKRMPVKKYSENQEYGMMKGVYFRCTKWQSAIKVDKKQIHLGTFASQEEAAHLYDRAAFIQGRKPNSELSEEEKQELRKLSWEEFLALNRTMMGNKMYKSPVEVGLLLSSKFSLPNNDQESEQEGENNDAVSPAAAAISGGINVVSPVAVAKEEEVEARGSNVVSFVVAAKEKVAEVERDSNVVFPAAAKEKEGVSSAGSANVVSPAAANVEATKAEGGSNVVSPTAAEEEEEEAVVIS